MLAIANRNALSEAIAVAGSVVASRTPKPILQCVKISATGSELLLTATDLEIGMRYVVRQVEVSEPGEVVVPADKFSQIVRESTDETLELNADADRCHIRGRDSHFQVFAQDPKDFPPVAELEGQADIEVEAAVLRKLIERTSYAAARENTRYAINGVLWERKGQTLVLVATDGRRLAWASGAVKKAAGSETSRIVPIKAMSILLRLLGEPEAIVQIRFLPNQLVVSTGAATLSSVLLEGNFPDYDKVIPRDNDKSVELDVHELHSAVRRAALLTSEQSKGIRLSFKDGTLVLASRAPEQGEATISMDVKYDKEPVEIGFNPTFLSDALRIVDVPSCVLVLKDGSRPGLMRIGDDFVYVIMPVNLS
ncbi:MAG: DNA polymerase III subunit beta [Phycisphaerae bacterium]|nr:DNA polymerase III subunit beta [Phycisphaerae bacterium]